jgi:hypothetical protein
MHTPKLQISDSDDHETLRTQYSYFSGAKHALERNTSIKSIAFRSDHSMRLAALVLVVEKPTGNPGVGGLHAVPAGRDRIGGGVQCSEGGNPGYRVLFLANRKIIGALFDN